MSEAPGDPSESREPESAARPRGKGPPAWGVALFLVLLGGMLLVNQWAATSGAEIEWIENDLDAALAQVSDEKPRVFLYVYEPKDEDHKRNELQLFTQRWARKPLRHAVSCRIALREGDSQAAELKYRFRYDGRPLFLLLDASGDEQSRTAGRATESEYMTYIGRPIEQAWKNRQKRNSAAEE